MTLKNAAEQVFFDPEKPTVSQRDAYIASLLAELKSIGFAEPVENGNPLLSDRVEPNNDFQAIRLLGKTRAGFAGIYLGALLDISLEQSPEGNTSINLHSDTGSVHVSQTFPQGMTSSDRYLSSMSPVKAHDKVSSFNWSDREKAEQAIASWIIQNADAGIASQLRPIEMPKVDLRKSADREPG